VVHSLAGVTELVDREWIGVPLHSRLWVGKRPKPTFPSLVGDQGRRRANIWLLQQVLVYHALKPVGFVHWGHDTLLAIWTKAHQFRFGGETHVPSELSVQSTQVDAVIRSVLLQVVVAARFRVASEPALGSSNRLRFIRFIARVLSNGDGKGKRMRLQWWAATHRIPAPQKLQHHLWVYLLV